MSKQYTDIPMSSITERLWSIVEQDREESLSGKPKLYQDKYSDYSCRRLMTRAGYVLDSVEGTIVDTGFEYLDNFKYLCMLVYYHYTDEAGKELYDILPVKPRYQPDSIDLETLGYLSIPSDICIRFSFGTSHLEPLYVAADIPSGRMFIKGERIDWYNLNKTESSRRLEFIRSRTYELDRESYYERQREEYEDLLDAYGGDLYNYNIR